jgi:hypothetical protein
MNSNLKNYLWVFFITFWILGCTTVTPTNTPVPDSWSATPYIHYNPPMDFPKYIHYAPSRGFKFGIEFDYPGYWWIQEYSTEGGISTVYIGDPLFLTLPTPEPYGNHHPTLHDYGSIIIWEVPSKEGETLESELASHKDNYSQISWITVLNDYKIAIDGRKVLILEYLTNDMETSPSIMFNRRIYFLVGDQIYEIIYSVAEKDRGGEFDQGFDYFLKSIKIKE